MSSQGVLRAVRVAASRSPLVVGRRAAPCLTRSAQRSYAVSQRPGSDRVRFPGAVNSLFTDKLDFQRATEADAMPTYRILDQDGQIVDKTKEAAQVDDVEAVKWYRDMLSISIMDIIMFEAQRQGRLSFYMVNAGEEGVAVGAAAGLEPNDPCFPQYREAGFFQYRGFTLDEFMSQLFANKNDAGKGRNMPVHYGSKRLSIHTISSPLATQIPQASGGAYALKLQNAKEPDKPQRCAISFFGEGAASEGDFHAALNFAATRSCPIIFLCRNNGYAISTPSLEQYRGDGIASRGVGYGIDTIRVDGNDILAVREVTRQARELCLKDGGRPVLIEAMCYRISHHSTSDDSFAYRSKVEVEDWKRRDNPITRWRKYLEHRGLWNEEKEKEARSSIRKDILTAFNNAEKEKKPAIRNMFEDVYENLTEESKAQMASLADTLDRYPNEYDLSDFEDGREGLNMPSSETKT